MSPRPGPERPIVGVRIKPDAINYIDGLAAGEGVTRSEMIRRLLAESITARQRTTRYRATIGDSILTVEQARRMVNGPTPGD